MNLQEKTIKKEIGKKIKKARIENEMTQHQLATKLNKDQRCVSSWEKGSSSPKIIEIIKMKKLINLNLNL